MSDIEVPPVDDYKDEDASDFMLHEDDDFKPQNMVEVDVAPKEVEVTEPEPAAVAASVPEPAPAAPTVVAAAVTEPKNIAVETEEVDLFSDVQGFGDEQTSSNVAKIEEEPTPMKLEAPKELKEVPVVIEQMEPVQASASSEVAADIVSGNRVAKLKVADEPTETYDIVVHVSDPHKVGEGMMNSYMAYKVKTKTSLTQFKSNETYVDRRFSDFLGLHEKLLAKHRHAGQIVPPAPEKSVVGMTLVKMSKNEEEATSIDFVEKRRASLERYMNRLVRHAPIINDQDLIDFLEQPSLPQATSTRALSGAGLMRFYKNVEGAVNKMTTKMVEEDSWFEEKQQQIEALEVQLKKLHVAFESLVSHRKDLALNTALFAKSAASLGNAEEHTSLSRALAQLSDSFEKLENQHQDQANKDFFHASEILSDYLRIIEEIKQVFMVRVKSWQTWKQAEQALQRKREAEMKIQASGRADKLSQVKAEITELIERVALAKKDFESLSDVIKEEVGRFEKDRIVDFQKMVLVFLKNMMKAQEQCTKNWEAFLPEAKAIA